MLDKTKKCIKKALQSHDFESDFGQKKFEQNHCDHARIVCSGVFSIFPQVSYFILIIFILYYLFVRFEAKLVTRLLRFLFDVLCFCHLVSSLVWAELLLFNCHLSAKAIASFGWFVVLSLFFSFCWMGVTQMQRTIMTTNTHVTELFRAESQGVNHGC